MNISLPRRKGSMTMVFFMFSPRILSNSWHYSLEMWAIVMPRIWLNPWWSIVGTQCHNGRQMFRFLCALRATRSVTVVDRKIPSHMANDHDNPPFGERQPHEEPPSTATKSFIVAMREGGRSRIYHAATASNFIVKSTTSNHSATTTMTIIHLANNNDAKSCRPLPQIAFLVGMREGALQNYHAASSSDLPPSSSKVGHALKTSNHLANDHDNHPLDKNLELPSAATNGCSCCNEGRDTEEFITQQHHRICRL